VTYDIPIEVISREVSKAKGIGIERLCSLTRERKGGSGQRDGFVSGEGTGGSEGEGDCGAFSAEFDEDKPGDH